jgi:hypothetical protein
MQSQRLLVALKLCVLLVLLTAARAWPMAGLASAAGVADIATGTYDSCALTTTGGGLRTDVVSVRPGIAQALVHPGAVLAKTPATFSANGASAAATPTPVAEVYLEGTLVFGVECILLETAPGDTWLLGVPDLQGFTVGDRVGIWGNLCPFPCFSFCQEGSAGAIDDIKGIIGLDPVGGIAELPRLDGGQAEVAGTPLEMGGSSGPSVGLVAGVAAAVAAGALALGSAAWYARRRWGR